jgi:hypothetical protein
LPHIASYVTTDMTTECVSMWSQVMIAQANSCVYENGVKKKMARSLLAKLAIRVSSDYQSCKNAAVRLQGAIGDR